MKAKLILLGIFLCLCSINARHFSEQTEQTEEEQTNTNRRENGHRRKRYHMSYGYDYSPPANPFYPYRREYDRAQDLLPEIFRLLDEISAFVRRPPPPPPPPQPIYIPYAVPYPACNCQASQQPQPQPLPNITSRFPGMEDTNQNWGLVDDGYDDDGDGDGSRPLSFTPIKPKTPMSRPPAALDHGTQHARAPSASASAPAQAKPHVPEMCEVFSLSCCSGTPAQQRQCFITAGCADTYNNGKGCEQDRLLRIIDEYSKAYAPAQ